MTGSELKDVLTKSNLTIKEVSNWLEIEVEQINDLMSLGNEKIPVTMAQQVRPVFEKYDR